MIAFTVYAIGVLSLMVSDILVTTYFTDTDIALWSQTRSLFGILAAIVTLGLEMEIIRSPSESRGLLKLIFIQAIVISIPLGYFVSSIGYFSNPISAILLSTGAAFSLAHGQYFRAHKSFITSQLSQQGWRFIVLIILFYLLNTTNKINKSIDVAVGATIFIASLFGWIIIASDQSQRNTTIQKISSHYAISLRFFATNIILTLALFGEQIIVNKLGTRAEAASYFTHLTYFIFPYSIVTTYVGFRIGPWVRDNPLKFEILRTQNKTKIHLLIFITASITHAIGWLAWILVNPKIGNPDPILQIFFFISSIIRTYYLFPSVFNGLFASTRDHDALIWTQIILITAICISIYTLANSNHIIYIVAILGATNWFSRYIIANIIMNKIIKSRMQK